MEKEKQLPYGYQERDIHAIFKYLQEGCCRRLLYQLPTGGGKTVIFSEIARRYINTSGKKVLVLTHRKELCAQTSRTLSKLKIKTLIVDSSFSGMVTDKHKCVVAMVETLRNRLSEKKIELGDVGLVIIDEAHHNSFRKLLKYFSKAHVIGVTATPYSSDSSQPLHNIYDRLMLGESVESLIAAGYLAKPRTWQPDMELNTLEVGPNGDFTVKTSDELYSSNAMLSLLLDSYQNYGKGKKTLIFNNGVATSLRVCQFLNEQGIEVRHLDHKTPAAEREEILHWFKKTKGAVLTSVSILTTGFDEPSIQCILINRATNSLTLYHQMVGRGSRRLPTKRTFTIIDLGNNAERFGKWEAALDWQQIFENPVAFQETIAQRTAGDSHLMPSEMRSKFGNSLEIAFDVIQAYDNAIKRGLKPQIVIRDSIRQHAKICMENSETASQALALSEMLEKEIIWRIKQYAACIGKATKNYRDWLAEDYKRRLRELIARIGIRQAKLSKAS